MRKATINRKTGETDINLVLNLDGTGEGNINTGCGFLDHMLTLFKKHGRFDLDVQAKGDTYVDYHHTVEDIGIALGQAFKQALGDKAGISRYADTTLPMDESLILTAVDISGRGFIVKDIEIKANKVGDFDTELLDEFLTAFALNASITLHARKICGSNAHHIIEGTFKSLAISLRKAVAIDGTLNGQIPSTKGVL